MIQWNDICTRLFGQHVLALMGKGKPNAGFCNICEKGVNVTNTQTIFKELVKDMFENMLRIKSHFILLNLMGQ